MEECTTGAQKRNAFTELMAAKPKATEDEEVRGSPPRKKKKFNGRRDALLSYIQNPESHPCSVVVRVTPQTVLIRDAFPKATVHLLLLPRSPAHYDLHPVAAFEDTEFLAAVRAEASFAAALVAAELKRTMSDTSATVRKRRLAEDAGMEDDDDALPPDRDFSVDVRVGVHAHPSMSHLHVHIISRDMHSEKVKHRKHYNSFNTPFFIPLADFPLPKDDERRKTAVQNGNLAAPLVCWRCGRDFGNRFAELKKHLEVEFGQWSRE